MFSGPRCCLACGSRHAKVSSGHGRDKTAASNCPARGSARMEAVMKRQSRSLPDPPDRPDGGNARSRRSPAGACRRSGRRKLPHYGPAPEPARSGRGSTPGSRINAFSAAGTPPPVGPIAFDIDYCIVRSGAQWHSMHRARRLTLHARRPDRETAAPGESGGTR